MQLLVALQGQNHPSRICKTHQTCTETVIAAGRSDKNSGRDSVEVYLYIQYSVLNIVPLNIQDICVRRDKISVFSLFPNVCC